MAGFTKLVTPSMEQLVRPWVSVDSTSKPRTPTAPEEEFPESFIRWGAASEFSTGDDTFRDDAASPGFKVSDEAPQERKRLTFPEEGRSWTDFKVENPTDPAQYAIVRRVNTLALTGPDGEQYLFILSQNASTPGTEEGSGQEPPAPPALDEIP